MPSPMSPADRERVAVVGPGQPETKQRGWILVTGQKKKNYDAPHHPLFSVSLVVCHRCYAGTEDGRALV